jgi:HEAT repeat protein
MLQAIYTIISLQVLILAFVIYLILHRFVENLLRCYAERRRRYFEPHVLNLLDDPTATEPLERGLFPHDRKFIKELLLQQAYQLKGEDRRNMVTVFEKLGYVKGEMIALRSKRWWRRLEAAINLGTMQSHDAVSVLIGAVRDPVEDVRLASVRALGQLNEPRGLQVLLEAIEKGDRSTGSNVVKVLVGMGPSIASEIISRLKSTTNFNARLLYVQISGLLRLDAALEVLLLLLGDPDKETRASAARALGQIGDVTAVESLIVLLDDKSWEVKAQAAKALGMLGDKQAVRKLKQALTDENWWVRHNAAYSLCQLGKEGIDALREASRPSEGAPSTAAIQILAEITLGV